MRTGGLLVLVSIPENGHEDSNILLIYRVPTSPVKAKTCYLHTGFNKGAFQQLEAAFQRGVSAQAANLPNHTRSRLTRHHKTHCFPDTTGHVCDLSNSTSLTRLVSTIARPTCWCFLINSSSHSVVARKRVTCHRPGQSCQSNFLKEDIVLVQQLHFMRIPFLRG